MPEDRCPAQQRSRPKRDLDHSLRRLVAIEQARYADGRSVPWSRGIQRAEVGTGDGVHDCFLGDRAARDGGGPNAGENQCRTRPCGHLDRLPEDAQRTLTGPYDKIRMVSAHSATRSATEPERPSRMPVLVISAPSTWTLTATRRRAHLHDDPGQLQARFLNIPGFISCVRAAGNVTRRQHSSPRQPATDEDWRARLGGLGAPSRST